MIQRDCCGECGLWIVRTCYEHVVVIDVGTLLSTALSLRPRLADLPLDFCTQYVSRRSGSILALIITFSCSKVTIVASDNYIRRLSVTPETKIRSMICSYAVLKYWFALVKTALLFLGDRDDMTVQGTHT